MRYIQFIDTICTDKESHTVCIRHVMSMEKRNVQMKFDISKMKCWDLKGSEDMTEPAGSSSGNDQGGMDTSTTTEKTSPTGECQ